MNICPTLMVSINHNICILLIFSYFLSVLYFVICHSLHMMQLFLSCSFLYILTVHRILLNPLLLFLNTYNYHISGHAFWFGFSFGYENNANCSYNHRERERHVHSITDWCVLCYVAGHGIPWHLHHQRYTHRQICKGS